MLDMILDFLTYVLLFTEIALIIACVIIFFVAATWFQVNDKREACHEQKE